MTPRTINTRLLIYGNKIEFSFLAFKDIIVGVINRQKFHIKFNSFNFFLITLGF